GLLLASAALLAAMAAGPALAQMPCMNEVMPLRQAVEKDAAALKAAIDRKADRSEICNGFKRFAAAEAKFLKYLEANQQWCGVPPDAIKQVKTGHDNTLKMRGQACAAGPIGGQPGPPPGPGLSEALGTSRAHMPAAGPADRGTYNTLTGNPFDR
ncbi:MAG TPA: hypothetical protein VHG27_09790, partial [Xanthobacteraceae bacterium]|nr:hypothetical protein [Xanthobacteraceae bacterium]